MPVILAPNAAKVANILAEATAKLRFIGECLADLHSQIFQPNIPYRYRRRALFIVEIQLPTLNPLTVNLTDPVFRGIHRGHQKHDGSFMQSIVMQE